MNSWLGCVQDFQFKKGNLTSKVVKVLKIVREIFNCNVSRSYTCKNSLDVKGKPSSTCYTKKVYHVQTWQGNF